MYMSLMSSFLLLCTMSYDRGGGADESTVVLIAFSWPVISAWYLSTYCTN